MNNSNNLTYYNLGKRDGLADLFVLIRIDGLVGGVRRATELMRAINPENPHTEHVEKILKEHEGNRVFLLTSGDGGDGDEWQLHSIHSTSESADKAKAEFQVELTRLDGSTFHHEATIEEWPVEGCT